VTEAATGGAASAAIEALYGPPGTYIDEVAVYVRQLALAGRGEDVRGRNLLALRVLEASYAEGWLSYAPKRDVVRWLLMLLDLVGAERGYAPRARLERTFEAFLSDVEAAGLTRLAEVTREASLERLARELDWPLAIADALGAELSMAALLWRFGFSTAEYRAQVHFEKNSQGKLIRRKITAALDGPWAEALRTETVGAPITALHVLAALPPAFEVVIGQVRRVMDRVGDRLDNVPFAVFYALVTDAARSGRRWQPPERFVHGSAYTRDDFERAVGRVSRGSRSRGARSRRSASLAELGLSNFFPETVAVIDAWLVACQCSELWVEPLDGAHAGSEEGWLELARAQRDTIAEMQERIRERVGVAIGRRS